MSFLPIVERELRVGARSPRTHRERWISVLVIMGLAGVCLVVRSRPWSTPASHGRDLFEFFSVAIFVVALGMGFVTADSLSKEKREGTLGLLFLTELQSYDVVLGKLFASSLSSVYFLFGAFPLLSLPVLLGGVTAPDFFFVQLSVLNALFFGLSAGLLVSSVTEQSRKATLVTGLLIYALTVGMQVLEGLVLKTSHPGVTALISPAYSLYIALGGTNAANLYWPSLLLSHMVGWTFLFVACWLLPRAWKQGIMNRGEVDWMARLKDYTSGDSAARRRHRVKTINKNPIYWLDDRHRFDKSILWTVLLGLITAVFGFWTAAEGEIDLYLVVGIGAYLHVLLAEWIGAQAIHRFLSDRQSGVLELLLVTPMSTADIMRGRMMAMRRHFAWPIGVVLLLDLLMATVLGYIGEDNSHNAEYRGFLVCLVLGEAGMILLQGWAMAWVGLQLGLTTRSWAKAVALATLRILVVHWVAFGFFWHDVHWTSPPVNPWFRAEVTLGVWFVLGLCITVPQGLAARKKLLNEFRELAG